MKLTKKELKERQTTETVEQDSKGITVRLATITCGCGWERGITHMYQCLYCRVWFCENCAEDHFGMTRAEHRRQKEDKTRSNHDIRTQK